MRQTPVIGAALIASAALCLSGCVAAAIPVVAGGALARTATDGIDAQSVEANSKAAQATAGPDPKLAAAARQELIRLSQGGALMAIDPVAPDGSISSGDPVKAGAMASQRLGAFADFARYAKSKAALDAEASLSGSGRALSAILSDPSALDGARNGCKANEPVVVIDLDRAGSLYAPDMVIKPNASLAQELRALRAQKIAIVWISGASAAYAGDVRIALKSSGLDPDGTDQILLMRYPGDRKQTRRTDLAASACLLAIAGDERADFDELFRYLTRPEAALGLELLIGNGWFLVPSLFDTDYSTPALVSKDTQTP